MQGRSTRRRLAEDAGAVGRGLAELRDDALAAEGGEGGRPHDRGRHVYEVLKEWLKGRLWLATAVVEEEGGRLRSEGIEGRLALAVEAREGCWSSRGGLKVLWRPCMRRLYGLYYQDLKSGEVKASSEQESFRKEDLPYLFDFDSPSVDMEGLDVVEGNQLGCFSARCRCWLQEGVRAKRAFAVMAAR